MKVLLALGEAKIAAHKPDDAQKIADEIMTLQPEGRVNAQARLLAGEVQMERRQFEKAGKTFMSVALLYDDPEITPQALQKRPQPTKRPANRMKPSGPARNCTRNTRTTPAADLPNEGVGGSGLRRRYNCGR